MKKIFKALIALVVITVLAVGAYFIFSKNDGTFAIYNNAYNLSYGVEQDDENVINKVNSAVDNMLNIIEIHSLDISEVQNNLLVFKNLKDNYSYINEEILHNGGFLQENNAVNKYIEVANNCIGKVKTKYLDGYKYLKNTYFKIVNTNYNVSTMKDYIVNFDNLFNSILNDYNTFYFNLSIAYSHCLSNTMLKNNAYKLSVECCANLINEYFNSTQSCKNTLLFEAQKKLTKLNEDYAEKYFSKKTMFDNLIDISLSLNIGEICVNFVSGTINNYINQLTEETDKVLVNNYVQNVIGGEQA